MPPNAPEAAADDFPAIMRFLSLVTSSSMMAPGRTHILVPSGDLRAVARRLIDAAADAERIERLEERATRGDAVHLKRYTRLADALKLAPFYSCDAAIDEAIKRLAACDTLATEATIEALDDAIAALDSETCVMINGLSCGKVEPSETDDYKGSIASADKHLELLREFKMKLAAFVPAEARDAT